MHLADALDIFTCLSVCVNKPKVVLATHLVVWTIIIIIICYVTRQQNIIDNRKINKIS